VRTVYGDKYYQARRYKNKNESAQEAHEAIRPTAMSTTTVNDPDSKRLYELIWKRTMASQMADAVLEKTIAKIGVSTNGAELIASGEVMKFEGFTKVYREDRDEEDVSDDEENGSMLPPLQKGQVLNLRDMKAVERFTRPQPRYTEASLVKKLEELGIGRPSTYAPTISTILKRGYVEKRDKEGMPREYRVLTLMNGAITHKKESEITGAEKAKLFPSDLGLVVTDFLKQHFDEIMDYGFTARIEEEFDEVAQGKMRWSKMIDAFYNPFKQDVQKTIDTAERISGERNLGTDPLTGQAVIARMGRYGPMVQIGRTEGEEKPRFAKLKANQSIETINLEEAFELFSLPRTLGQYNDNEVVVNIGRFGPYIKYGEDFVSLPKGVEPLEVDLEQAISYINQKQVADAPIGTYENLPVTKGKGRFGPFIKWNDLYINVPRAYNFDSLSQKDINELIEKKLTKEANRYIQNWPGEKIAIENGRWGPFIRFGKKMLKLPYKGKGEKYTPEELAAVDVDVAKKWIEQQVPGAFNKKTAAKKTAPKKAAAKRATAKKAAPKKK
jgi:DNA topoisomerase-1